METVYKVYWDNGINACGTFPHTFETEEEAQEFADNWVSEMCAADGVDVDDEEAYSAEVIEVEVPDTEGEGWDPVGELSNAGLSGGKP